MREWCITGGVPPVAAEELLRLFSAAMEKLGGNSWKESEENMPSRDFDWWTRAIHACVIYGDAIWDGTTNVEKLLNSIIIPEEN